MHLGPLFAWGSAAGTPVRPAALGWTPPPQAPNWGFVPGGLIGGPGPRARPPGGADRAFQAPDQGGIGAACLPGAQVAGQFDRAVTDAQQAAHLETHGAPQPAHLAVAPLVQHDPQGAVAAPRALFVRAADPIEAPRTVFQLHSSQNWLRTCGPGRPRSRTRYSRSTSLEGCMRRWASSPSVVRSRSPAVFTSSRPTAIQRP